MKNQRRLQTWLLILACTLVATACNRDKPAEPTPAAATESNAPTTSTSPTSQVRYIERMTGGAKTTDKVPVIVGIHGLGDRPESFGRIFDGFSAPARLILPYGLSTYSDGFSWFPISNLEPNVLAEGTTKAADELAKMLSDIESTKPLAGKPIVTGFSQGGMLSFTLAVLHPEHVGEALPIAGLLAPPLYPKEWPMTKTAPNVTAFHGNADNRVPFDGAKDTVQHLTAVGFSATLTEYPGVRHTISPEMRRDWMTALEAAVKTASNH
ncbi:MAG TPA: dienelactone hydrolase family protein [Polyangium sp.]|jgi:phospholipase/carboxylesterase|nr:dienelactone hydrolase family protein [Polyangium sp.]